MTLAKECLTSARGLGDEVSRALGCFLTWRISQEQILLDRTLYAVGLLLVALRLHEGKIPDQTLDEAANWILTEEAIECREFPFDPTDPPPLAFGIQQGLWRPLAVELRGEAAAIEDIDVREKLELIALYLEPNWPA
jgi:hypothetical protein